MQENYLLIVTFFALKSKLQQIHVLSSILIGTKTACYVRTVVVYLVFE